MGQSQCTLIGAVGVQRACGSGQSSPWACCDRAGFGTDVHIWDATLAIHPLCCHHSLSRRGLLLPKELDEKLQNCSFMRIALARGHPDYVGVKVDGTDEVQSGIRQRAFDSYISATDGFACVSRALGPEH